ELGRGLRAAFRALLRKPVRVRYLTEAGEMVPVPERYRGKITYDKGACIGCLLCIRTCPSGAISTTEEKKVEFSVFKCTFCGQCAEICPKKAVKLGSDFELVVYEKEGMVVR
ncbi:MAG: 4Fe-4S binding protein, partial [Candidatus Brockarchaeota archaeon]|nr:4Fe-4S binding protein [Candidatus Brockarchaeota archaeon]